MTYKIFCKATDYLIESFPSTTKYQAFKWPDSFRKKDRYWNYYSEYAVTAEILNNLDDSYFDIINFDWEKGLE